MLRAVELQLVLRGELLESGDELAAKDAAACFYGREESARRIDSSGAVGRQAAGGNDVVDMRKKTSAPTIPCSRKAPRSRTSIRSIRFMVLLFRSSDASVDVGLALTSAFAALLALIWQVRFCFRAAVLPRLHLRIRIGSVKRRHVSRCSSCQPRYLDQSG